MTPQAFVEYCQYYKVGYYEAVDICFKCTEPCIEQDLSGYEREPQAITAKDAPI